MHVKPCLALFLACCPHCCIQHSVQHVFVGANNSGKKQSTYFLVTRVTFGFGFIRETRCSPDADEAIAELLTGLLVLPSERLASSAALVGTATE